MTTLQFINVQKYYGRDASRYHAVRGFDAEIASGELVVIVGPSGCGKSTLLRMVAGLEEISDGQIVIGDRVVNDIDPARRDIAMVFQNYALYPHMTVKANMAYALKIAGLRSEEINTRVDHAAQILGITELLHRKPRELSGGQRQRVAMGRAIVRQPKVFLFDEPLSNLDAKLRVHTRLEIQKLHRRLGVTTLFVTHDQVEAMTLAHRVIVMNAGEIEQFDTPEEIYNKPASIFVAGFIGSPPMNLFKFAPEVSMGKILGVRPEHFNITAEGWPVSVDTVELLGTERLIHGSLGQESIVIRIDSQEAVPDIGETIHVKPFANRLHWFDAQSMKRVEL
jgi:sn-glycerol 3-phosphate transport system ATP-binding protein